MSCVVDVGLFTQDIYSRRIGATCYLSMCVVDECISYFVCFPRARRPSALHARKQIVTTESYASSQRQHSEHPFHGDGFHGPLCRFGVALVSSRVACCEALIAPHEHVYAWDIFFH